MSPESGSISLVMSLRIEVFPAPVAPTIAIAASDIVATTEPT